jgi:hypothetical protein
MAQSDDRTHYVSDTERYRVKELMALRTRRRFIVVHERLQWAGRSAEPDATEYASEEEARDAMRRIVGARMDEGEQTDG